MAKHGKFTTILTCAAMSVTLAACGGAADTPAEEETVAAADAPPVLKERHDNFEEIGDSFKAIMDSLKSGSPDMAMIAEKAQLINTNAGKISGHFPEGTSVADGFDTEALPTIWEQPEEFASATEQLVTKSAALVAAAESGDAAAVGEAAKEMGGSCKNCHDTFRAEDED